MHPAKASPFGSNGDDRRQWRKQGGAVGAAASRMRAAAKQTLGAATRAVSPKVTERASPAPKSRCAAMGRLFVRAILSRCQSCLAASSPSQSRRKLLASSPKGGEPLAGRATFLWTPEARQGAKGRALLTGAAASGQRTLSSCRWPRQRSTTVSDKSSFARPVGTWPTRQRLPLWGSCPACGVTEKPP